MINWSLSYPCHLFASSKANEQYMFVVSTGDETAIYHLPSDFANDAKVVLNKVSHSRPPTLNNMMRYKSF